MRIGLVVALLAATRPAAAAPGDDLPGLRQALAAEASARQSADLAEETRARAAEAGLGLRIDGIVLTPGPPGPPGVCPVCPPSAGFIWRGPMPVYDLCHDEGFGEPIHGVPAGQYLLKSRFAFFVHPVIAGQEAKVVLLCAIEKGPQGIPAAVTVRMVTRTVTITEATTVDLDVEADTTVAAGDWLRMRCASYWLPSATYARCYAGGDISLMALKLTPIP